jgi:hypothetical protein
MKSFSNHATFQVLTRLEERASTYESFREMAIEAYKDEHNEELAAKALAICMRDKFEEDLMDIGNTVFGDLLKASLDTIKWNEIASYYLDRVQEDLNELDIDYQETLKEDAIERRYVGGW